ncbi:MAG: ribosome assembly cofactor RimP [Bacteroidales bacterium]|nr:ribosome assembly cofactor RimP [Bacteroidales bacterium]
MISKELIRELFETLPQLSGYFLTEVKVSPNNEISISADTDQGITIDQCGEISRILEENLDRDKEDFDLEVSSPGLSEPFKVLRQYIKNIGKEVDIVTVSGQKKKGRIIAADENGVEIETSRTEKQNGKKVKILEKETLEFSVIKTTKLKITFK